MSRSPEIPEPEPSNAAAAAPDADALRARCARIRALVLDVDGVLTDGGIVYDDRGGEIKRFCVRDGAGIRAWGDVGHRVAILSSRSSEAVSRRARELRIPIVIQGASEKLPRFRELLREWGVGAEEVAYVGDDLADLPPMRVPGLGLAACPADAAPEARAAAAYVADSPGGRGAAREIIAMILRSQGRWPPDHGGG